MTTMCVCVKCVSLIEMVVYMSTHDSVHITHVNTVY